MGEALPKTESRNRAGWIPCAICTALIGLDQYRTARCWTDPHGTTVAAHHACLVDLGETDLELPPAA